MRSEQCIRYNGGDEGAQAGSQNRVSARQATGIGATSSPKESGGTTLAGEGFGFGERDGLFDGKWAGGGAAQRSEMRS